ncbi:MAG: GAF domain-containing protein [SAR324 cluster bacterium]|nr:GAF domain-containing protein [SAR324 cluster bacterium]
MPCFLNQFDSKSCWILFAERGAIAFQGAVYTMTDSRETAVRQSERQQSAFFQTTGIRIDADHPVVMMLYEKQGMVVLEQIDEWLRERRQKLPANDLILQTALVSPVFFQGAIACIVGLDLKRNGQLYPREEQQFLRSVCYQLGAVVENVNLVSSLEHRVQERTSDLRNARNQVDELNTLIEKVNSTLDIDEVMLSVLEVLQKIFTFDAMVIELIDPSGQTLSPYRAYGDAVRQKHIREYQKIKIPVTSKESTFSYVIHQQTPFYRSPVTGEHLTAPFDRQYYEVLPFSSILLVPVSVRQNIIGAIGFMGVLQPFTLNSSKIEEIQHYVSHIANAIHNAMMFQKSVEKEILVQEQHKKLKQAQLQLVQSEKLAVLGTLVAGVAHEINTPASAIHSAIQEIARDYKELLGNMIQLTRGLPEDLGNLYYQACEQVMRFQKELSTQEERDLARDLAKVLEAHAVGSSRKLSKDLVKVGFTAELIPPFIPLFSSTQVPLIQQSLWQLGMSGIHVRNIRTAVERITHIVKAFKHHSHTDSSDVTSTLLQEDLENTLVILRNKWKQGVVIHREFAALPPFRCYASQLNQVWTNLIYNAIQAMLGKGELWVRLYAEEKWIIVEIEDNGPGISPEVLPRIFEHYFTTKAKGEGSGLGLSICEDIVKRHQGKIEVASVPGKTCFRVKLPLN